MEENKNNEELKEEVQESKEVSENKDMVPKQDYDELDDRYKQNLKTLKREVLKKEKDYIIQFFQI